jgi:MFS family permease
MTLPRSIPIALMCMLQHASATGCRAVLPLIALALGASPAAAGALVATQALAPAVLSLPIGQLVARRGTRFGASIGTALGGVAFLVMAAQASAWHAALPFVVAAAAGLGFALTLVSVQRELGHCVDEGEARAYDHFSLFVAISGSAGPLLAGVWLSAFGAQGAAIGLAMLVAASIATMRWSGLRWSPVPAQPGPQDAARLPAAQSALNRPARALLRAEVVISLLWNETAMLAILRSHDAGWSAAQGAAVLSVLGAGVAAARIAGPWVTNRASDVALIRLSMAAAGLGVASFVVPLPWLAVCALQFAVGVGLGVSLRPVLSELHRRCDAEGYTRVLAIRQLLLNLCAVAGPAAMGLLVGAPWSSAVFAVLGAMAVLSAWAMEV